jgi:putative peptidoglycan lipid II flippase
MLALLGGMGAIVITAGGKADRQSQVPAVAAKPTPAPAPAPTRPAAARIAVTGTGAYDPAGDGSENDGDAGLATDGNRATAWKSEHYRSAFTKAGVGLVIDAGRPVRANRVTVVTESPGYNAQVRVGTSAKGPFVSVSETKVTTPRTTFALQPRSGRYLMLWITSMPETGTAAVNEITVTAAG